MIHPLFVVTGYVREQKISQPRLFVAPSLTGFKKNTQDTPAMNFMLISHWIRQNWNLSLCFFPHTILIDFFAVVFNFF